MNKPSKIWLGLFAAGILSACATGPASQVGGLPLERQTLAANDGWAALDAGVSGGAAATAENVFTVSSRKELVDAFHKAGDAPKIILVKGSINLSTDDTGNELTEKDYAVAPYNFNEYMKAYAPAVWNVKLEKGRPVRDLTGPQEEAREASVKRQRAQVQIVVPSNTSIIGLGKDAKIVRGNLVVGFMGDVAKNAASATQNVIIRNITFEDAFDYFPGWDPGDSWKLDKSYPGCQEAYVDGNVGPQKCPGGRWNSEYDSISVNGGKRVWIDHCTFSDGDRPDKKFPPVFPFPHNEITQKVQHHDGAIDITNGADLVTVSFSHFKDHDKTNLIGGSDSKGPVDAGKLRATFHHNYYENIGQRMPRVRFGQVHVYNSYFVGDATAADDPKLNVYQNHLRAIERKTANNVFRQALGVGKDSAIYSENNVFDINNGGADVVAVNMGGKVFFDAGSVVNGAPTDLLKAANAVGKPLTADVGWKPTLYGSKVLPAAEVKDYVKANAGAGKL